MLTPLLLGIAAAGGVMVVMAWAGERWGFKRDQQTVVK